MWMFLSRRLRAWVLLCIALPLARVLVHRLALAAERRDPSARTARALRQADSAVTAVSRRASRRAAVSLPTRPWCRRAAAKACLTGTAVMRFARRHESG
jgi:hypothetical protein